jgi:hypothetical protein
MSNINYKYWFLVIMTRNMPMACLVAHHLLHNVHNNPNTPSSNVRISLTDINQRGNAMKKKHSLWPGQESMLWLPINNNSKSQQWETQATNQIERAAEVWHEVARLWWKWRHFVAHSLSLQPLLQCTIDRPALHSIEIISVPGFIGSKFG